MGSQIANAQEHIYRLERAVHALGGADYLAERRTGAAPSDKTPRPGDRPGRAGDAWTTSATADGAGSSARATASSPRSSSPAWSPTAASGSRSWPAPGTTQIIAGGTFYLIGASVGLFRQLRQAATAETVTEEDFGLGMVRLVHTPLASGLAAIGGVVLTAYATAFSTPACTRS